MKILKKTLMGTSIIGAVFPLALTISCGSKDASINFMTHKTDINKEGKELADSFEKTTDAKLSNEPVHWNSAQTAKVPILLASSFGSKNFPSAFRLADMTDIKTTWMKKDAILKFKDPVYKNEKATISGAEKTNIDLAGPNVNVLIKYLESNNKSSLLLKDNEGNIIGFPSFVEAFGIIYNKLIFKEVGIDNVIYDINNPTKNKTKGINWDVEPIIDESHNTLYTSDLTSDNFKKLKKWLVTNESKIEKKFTGYKGIMGNSFSGTDSSTVTEKLFSWGITTRLAQAEGLKHKGVVFTDYKEKENVGTQLTPKNLYDKMKATGNTPAKEIYSDAFDLYVKDAIVEPTKNAGFEDVFANKMAMTLGGVWREAKLPKGVDKLSEKYGLLPLSIGAGKTYNNKTLKPYVSKGASFWYFTNQEKATGKKGKAALDAQTKAINFYHYMFMSDFGKKWITKVGFVNPFTKPSTQQFLDNHPIMLDANKITNSLGLGEAFNATGQSSQNGMGKNNADYVKAVKDYRDNGDINALWQKVQNIWGKVKTDIFGKNN